VLALLGFDVFDTSPPGLLPGLPGNGGGVSARSIFLLAYKSAVAGRGASSLRGRRKGADIKEFFSCPVVHAGLTVGWDEPVDGTRL